MLLIYTKKHSPRLAYVLRFLEEQVFDQPCRVTHDALYFANHTGARLNYSEENFEGNVFTITPVTLLFETGIRPQIFDCSDKDGYPCFFNTKDDFGFDFFAAVFFLLSRYEEYLPFEVDSHGRYPYQNSVAYRFGFLDKPLVNIWMEAFRKGLLEKFPELGLKWKEFKVQLSYDIDMAYKFKEKGWIRNAAAFFRSVIGFNAKEIALQWDVLSGKQKDPFDSFEWLDAIHLYCRVKPLYFFLVAAKTGIYDKNCSTESEAFRKLLEYCSGQYQLGLHPSWQSGDKKDLLKEEKEWLEVVSEKSIVRSRQHYIRLSLPETYRSLEKAGIKEDYTMGYGTANGFRASVASSFLWYDLLEERTTDLRIHPFCYMDSTCYYHLKMQPQEGYRELMNYYETVKKHRGLFIGIWHNHLLGSDVQFKGWPELYELFMKETVYWGA